MAAKQRIWNNSKNQTLLLIFTVAIYNNWLIGLFINPRITRLGGTVSELSALDQPYSWLYRTLDLFAGSLLLICANFWAKRVGTSPRDILVLKIVFILVGIGTLIDAVEPLHCSTILSSACLAAENSYRLGFGHTLHICESVFVASASGLMPIITLKSSLKKYINKVLTASSLAVIITLLINGLDSANGVFRTHHENFGSSQRLYLVVFSIWIIVCFWAAGLYSKNNKA